MRTVEVPPTAADIPGWTNTRHICETHGILELEHLNAVVNTWQGHTVGILGRRAQDDTAFATMLRNSPFSRGSSDLSGRSPRLHHQWGGQWHPALQGHPQRVNGRCLSGPSSDQDSVVPVEGQVR